MKKISLINDPNNIPDIGIALAITGVPLGMYFNYLFPIIEWSPFFMLASVAAIINYKNLSNFKFPSINDFFKIVLIFQMLMVVYGLFSSKMTTKYLNFHLYILLLVVALSSRKRDYRILKNTIVFVFYLSSVCSILGAYFLAKGLIVGEDAWDLKQQIDNYALEIFTVCLGAIYNLISAIYLVKNRVSYFYVVYLMILIDFYIVIFSGKRTPVFVSIMSILISFLISISKVKLKSVGNAILGFLAVISLFILLYSRIDIFSTQVDKFSLNFINGVFNLLGNTEIKDASGSALYRFTQRQWVYDYIDNKFSLFNYFLGAGYMTRWIDNPILQSYLDMGILGFCLYLYIVVVFPIKTILRGNANKLIVFAFLLCIYNILSSINSGNPYMYIKFVAPIILAYFTQLFTIRKSKELF